MEEFGFSCIFYFAVMLVFILSLRNAQSKYDDFFAGSFQKWQTRCMEILKERTRQGFAAHVVEITIADFVQWAKLNDRTPDAQARAEYAGLHCGQMYYI